MSIIAFPNGYFPYFNKGKPLYNGKIYIGIPDLDPTIPANQLTVTAIQESGDEIEIPQPIRTSSGGVPIYNGSPVTLSVPGEYSMSIQDSLGNQIYYSDRAFPVTNTGDLNNAEERLLGAGSSLYKGSNGSYVQNGDTVPVGTTHLTVLVSGKAEDVRLSSSVSGVVADLTETSATVGGVGVTLHRFVNGGYQATSSQLAAITPLVGEMWFSTTNDTISVGDGATLGGIEYLNVNTIVDHTYRINTEDEVGVTGEDRLNNALSKSLPVGVTTDATVSAPIGILAGGNLKGVGSNLTTITALSGFIDYNSGRLDELLVEGLQITGPGKNDASGATCILKDGTQNSNRERYSKLGVTNFPVGISHSAGWGQDYNQLYVTDCGVGFQTTESSIESGWAGSGYVMTNCYFAGCDIGVQDDYIWNATYLNAVIENCGTPLIQNQAGTASVWVNPWFEDNTNTPQWRRGSIVLGGRGVDYSDVSFFRSNDCITLLDRDGVTVFNPDINSPEFKADGDGVKHFKGVLSSLGWAFKDNDAGSAKLLQVNTGGGVTSESSSSDSTEVTLTKLTGKRHRFGSQVASMPELGVEVRGFTSSGGSGTGSTRVVISTGTYESNGGASTNFGDRWAFESNGVFAPTVDNSFNIGSASLRVSEIFAANGAINTSDEREKTELLELSNAEKACALEIKESIRKFKFIDSVDLKGDDARIHFGVGAQTVKSIFEKHGLNPDSYSLLCKDEWSEEVTTIPCDESEKDAYPVTNLVQKMEVKKVVKNKIVTDSGSPVLTEYTEEVKVPMTEPKEVVDENGELVYETVLVTNEKGKKVPTKTVMTYEAPVMVEEINYFKDVKKEAGYRYGIRYSELAMFILGAL